MKLSYIEIVGFRGFKTKARFDFPLGFAVITGRNGVGKSTVFDALDFALTGTIGKYSVREAKGGGIDEHLWWAGDGTANEQYVSIGFVSESGTSVHLTRGRDGLLTSGSLESLATTLCTEPDEMPGWTSTLVNTSIIRDEMISELSMDLSEQARFSAVRAALGANEVTDYTEKFEEAMRLSKAGKEEQIRQHEKAVQELGRTLAELSEARSLASRKTDVAEARRVIATQIPKFDPNINMGQLRYSLVVRRKTLKDMQIAIQQAEEALAAQVAIETPEFLRELEQLQGQEAEAEKVTAVSSERLARASVEYERATEEDNSLAKYLELLDLGEMLGLQEGKCPLCSAPQLGTTFLKAIAEIKEKVRERTPRAAKIRAELNDAGLKLREDDAKRAQIAKQVRLLETRRRAIESDLNLASGNLAALRLGELDQLDNARTTLLKAQDELSKFEQATSVLESSMMQDRLVSLSNGAEHLRALVEEHAIRVNEAERAFDRAQQIHKMSKMISNEILSEKLDTVLPLLKELYRRLRPHADWRELEIDVAGQVRGSLNFVVGDGKNPQFLFSSGQRRAAGLAFLLALHLARPWCHLNTLMLDDPIQHVDDYRALNLVEVLSAIRRRGRQVIVAVEDSALADVLCRRLRGSEIQGGKRFDLSLDLEGSAIIATESEIPALTKAVFQLAEAS